MLRIANPFGDTRVFYPLCLGPGGLTPKPGNLRFEALIGLAADAIRLRGERRLGGRARSLGRLCPNLVGVERRLPVRVADLLGFTDDARQLLLEPGFRLSLRASHLFLEL